MIILSDPGNLALRLPGAYTPRKAHSPEAFIALPTLQISCLNRNSALLRLLDTGFMAHAPNTFSLLLGLKDFFVFNCFNVLDVVG
jgi:hypothetical protein